MNEHTYKIATSYPPYLREITVKTLCQMETEPRINSPLCKCGHAADGHYSMFHMPCLQCKCEEFELPLIIGPTDASLNIAKHRCS